MGSAPALGHWGNIFAGESAPDFSAFQNRRDWVLDTVVADPLSHRELYWAAQACFVRGKVARGLETWREAVRRQTRARVRGVELFNYWPAIHCIARWGHLLDTESKETIKRILTRFTEYKDMRTSNLVMLACVTRYLAGQVFGEEDFIEAAHYRRDDPNAARALRSLIEKCARQGFAEWASWPYFDKNLLPVLTVAELAADAELRQRALIAFEAGLARNAPFWLHGRWAMPTARSYPDILSQKPWGGPQLLWLYFGGTAPDVRGNLVGAAGMDYVPPPALETAAGDRSRPFTVRSHFGKNCQMSFIDRDYGVFSEAQGNVVNWWQCYPYGVMWNEPDPAKHSFLWLTAPMNDSQADISVSHPHGIHSRFQSNLQHEGVLLYVFDFSARPGVEAPTYPYALGFVPGGALALIDDSTPDGQIFLHYRSVLMAITASVRFKWDRAAGIRAASGTPNPDDSEFRVEGSPLAMAIECAHPDDIHGGMPGERLANFRDVVRAKARIGIAGAMGHYIDRNGNLIEREFHGGARINGKLVDFAEWPMMESPWVTQSRGASLTLTDGRHRRTYDFEHWTVTQ